MTIADFIATAKTKADQFKADLADFFSRHPELEADASALATSGADLAAHVATTEVNANAANLPPEVGLALDDAIATTQKAASDQIAQVQAAADAKVAQLQAAKAQVAPQTA